MSQQQLKIRCIDNTFISYYEDSPVLIELIDAEGQLAYAIPTNSGWDMIVVNGEIAWWMKR